MSASALHYVLNIHIHGYPGLFDGSLEYYSKRNYLRALLLDTGVPVKI